MPLTLPVNGSYRAFADFTTGGERRTLAIDLTGHGGPEPATVAWWDSITSSQLHEEGDRLVFYVRGDAGAGRDAAVPRRGGHLVVLRDGDLAYVHAHADEDELAFDVPFPSEGRYRLYLQFKVGGKVETVSRCER